MLGMEKRGKSDYFRMGGHSHGNDNLNSIIVIEIINEVQMKVIEGSGNFGVSVWNWEKEHLTFSQIVNRHHYQNIINQINDTNIK